MLSYDTSDLNDGDEVGTWLEGGDSYKQLIDSANSDEYDNTIIERLARRNELKILGYSMYPQ
jgi:microsomal dipeptidase-like Zn-dependent dipeptidase